MCCFSCFKKCSRIMLHKTIKHKNKSGGQGPTVSQAYPCLTGGGGREDGGKLQNPSVPLRLGFLVGPQVWTKAALQKYLCTIQYCVLLVPKFGIKMCAGKTKRKRFINGNFGNRSANARGKAHPGRGPAGSGEAFKYKSVFACTAVKCKKSTKCIAQSTLTCYGVTVTFSNHCNVKVQRETELVCFMHFVTHHAGQASCLYHVS
jgi:hypothetical protein